MKIVYLSTFYPFRGGIAQFNALVYRELEKDHDVQAITFTRQYPKFLFPGKTQYVSADDIADPIPAQAWLDSINPFSYWNTGRKIRKLKPELVVTKYWMTFMGPSLGFVLGRQSRFTKRLAILDNVMPHERRFFDHWFNRYFLNRNDFFIAMTEKVKQDLLHYVPNAKCLVVPHPVYNHFGLKLQQADALKSLNVPYDSTSKYLLFFGIIRDYKGLDILIDAMALLGSEFKLILAGESYGSFEKYESQIQALNLQDRCFVFQRYIDDHEVPLFFSAAELCVLPYRSATQSGITGIAQHFELPILATNVGGLAETILHDQTGWIVPNANPEDIANGIVHFFDQNKSQYYQQEIRKLNEKNSWTSFSQALIKLLKDS